MNLSETFATAEPGTVTVEDCAQWCENLAKEVRANPDGKDWAVLAYQLYRRLAAAAHLAEEKNGRRT